uniref:Uncharacterized protein n=1 Tax=Zea mays TaxID=4577 RepID=C0PFW4_MAIZE|nr:unknown [Zea mays]
MKVLCQNLGNNHLLPNIIPNLVPDLSSETKIMKTFLGLGLLIVLQEIFACHHHILFLIVCQEMLMMWASARVIILNRKLE